MNPAEGAASAGQRPCQRKLPRPPDAWSSTAYGELAQETGAELTVVHVRAVPFPGADQELGAGELETYWRAAQRRAQQRSGEALAGSTARWRFEVHAGDPAEELERVAAERHAELLVVGCRGQSMVGRVLLGSVSTRLAHHADRPILVVR